MLLLVLVLQQLGQLVPIPVVGTVAGAAAGYFAGELLNHKWGKSDDSSLTGATKKFIKDLF